MQKKAVFYIDKILLSSLQMGQSLVQKHIVHLCIKKVWLFSYDPSPLNAF